MQKDERVYEVFIDHLPDRSWLVIKGKASNFRDDELCRRVESLIRSKSIKNLGVDLSDCSFISSTVMSFLVKYSDMSNGELVPIVGASVKIRKTMETVGLDGLFKFQDKR